MKERIKFILNKRIKKIYLSDDLSLNEKKVQLKEFFENIDKKVNNWYIKFDRIYWYWYWKTNKIVDALRNNNDFSEILEEMSEKINNYLVDKLIEDLFINK